MQKLMHLRDKMRHVQPKALRRFFRGLSQVGADTRQTK